MNYNETDISFLKASIELAATAAEQGIHPFAAILVNDKDEVLMEQVNGYLPDLDMTGHAERVLMTRASKAYRLDLPCRKVFESGQREVEVIGPLLEEEAAKIHETFWNR